MKKLFLLIFFLFAFSNQVFATSQQAFADYRYQYDIFRIKDRDYRVAIGEYKQYGTLSSQQKAIDAAKTLLIQRNTTVRTYFLLLNEKLTDNPSMTKTERETLRKLLTDEIAFVENQSAQISSKNSLEELNTLALSYTKHAPIQTSAIRQIIVGIQIGYLLFFASQYDTVAQEGQLVAASSSLSPDLWFLQIATKRTLLQQSLDMAKSAPTAQTNINQARQYLIDGISYMKELQHALAYE